MKNIKHLFVSLAVAITAMTFQSCDKAQANVQTLISNDCGVTWTLIEPGKIIPKRMTQCELKTTIPGAPMTGDSHFKTTFKNDVKASIDLDYEYEIIDPVKFISEAKYLAKANVDGDEVSSNSSRFESAENSIIDKRIKESARDLLNDVDIVDFDQSVFEDQLLTNINKSMEERGIKINYLSFVPTPSEQTSQAIDVATAMRIYQSKNLEEIGKLVISNKAGANKIIITPASSNQTIGTE